MNHTMTLTEDDYQALLLMMGFALGTALHQGDHQLLCGFVRLLNRINEHHPTFRPYEIPGGKDAGIPPGGGPA